MQDLIDKKGPIGAWVREADDVFTNLIRKTSENGSLIRIEWQYFNLIKERGKVTSKAAQEFLNFFDNKEAIGKVLSRFQK